MFATTLSAVLFIGQLGAGWIWSEAGWSVPHPQHIVEQTVDLISVAHVKDGQQQLYFWALVQNEWALLDYRHLPSESAVCQDGNDTVVFFLDQSDNCFRSIRSTHWLETWEDESPMASQHGRPWFARLLCPGLKQPPAKQ